MSNIKGSPITAHSWDSDSLIYHICLNNQARSETSADREGGERWEEMPQQNSEIRPQKRHKIAVDICRTRKIWVWKRKLHHFRSRVAISQGQQSWAVSVGQHLDWVFWPPRPFQRRTLPHSFTHLHAAKMCTDLLLCAWCFPPTFVWPCQTSSTSLTLVQISYHTSFYQYGNFFFLVVVVGGVASLISVQITHVRGHL